MRLLTAAATDITGFHAIVRTAGRGVVAVAASRLIELLVVLHQHWRVMAVGIAWKVRPEFE